MNSLARADAGALDLAAPAGRPAWRRIAAFFGPGTLVAVGYIDPGNWATDLAGGSAYGYGMLWVVVAAGLLAMLLQILAARLGIATGKDLAQLCREHSSPLSARLQWLLCEAAICACDVAEVIGAAVALELLFGLPLPLGMALTTADALLLLWLGHRGLRRLEAALAVMIATVCACFAATLAMAHPAMHPILAGLQPHPAVLRDSRWLLLAVGILGATVMPHNLYLHSAAVRHHHRIPAVHRRRAMHYVTVDTIVSLGIALLVNLAIMVTAAAVFHDSGHRAVADLREACGLLSPLLGTASAGTLFAVALLAAGISAAVTVTIAGEVVMQGYLNLRMTPWKRRMATRLVAVVPALLVATCLGEAGISRLLIGTQVLLSLQLPFAMVPLARLTGSREVMGAHASPAWLSLLAWAAVAGITGLDIAVLAGTLRY